MAHTRERSRADRKPRRWAAPGAAAPRRTEVAVVGFGPVGAVLACLLGAQGVRVTVLDREAGIYALPRAAHIDHTGLRTLQEIGCLDDLLPTMIPNAGTDVVTTHGELLLELPTPRATASGLPASMYFYQPTFDRRLRESVMAMPTVDVHLGCEVDGLEPVTDGVNLHIRSRSEGDRYLRADWVVGCDGASSFVREALGIQRTSFEFEEEWFICDLVLKEEDLGLPERAVQVCDPIRPRTELPMPGNRFRYEFRLLADEQPEELRDAATAFARLPAQINHRTADLERTATYTFQGLVADAWRDRRTFIAGDAAHLMPPFLGQGMCSGIRDATNLAWKLGRVIRGPASDGLLASYEEERRPHVSKIVQSAVDLGSIITARGREPQDLLSTYRFSLPPLDKGTFVFDGGGELFPQPRVEGRPLDDVVGPRFLVLARDDHALADDALWWSDAGALVTTLARLPGAAEELGEWLDRRDATVAVVRPDRYVLGVGHSLEELTHRAQAFLTTSSNPAEPNELGETRPSSLGPDSR